MNFLEEVEALCSCFDDAKLKKDQLERKYPYMDFIIQIKGKNVKVKGKKR